jgi:hypothetical protein
MRAYLTDDYVVERLRLEHLEESLGLQRRKSRHGPTLRAAWDGISCNNITTIPNDPLGRQIGALLDSQELALSDAIAAVRPLAS